VASGKEKEPFPSAPDFAPVCAKLTPSGRFLLSAERRSYDTGDTTRLGLTMVRDLATGKSWKLCDDFALPHCSPDEKTVVMSPQDNATLKSQINVFELKSGTPLATFVYPENDRHFSVGGFAQDGKVVALHLGGKKGAPLEVWFFDARTLENLGKLIGKGDPDRYGWGHGQFTPDGKRFVDRDGAGNVLIWNVAEQKVERTETVGGTGGPGGLSISPDGETVAVAWRPRTEADLDDDPDILDLAQPRVTLIDLVSQKPPRVLIAPHGYPGRLTFSPDGRLLAFGGAGAVHLFDLTK
jgi:WD40 repeat protein